MAMDSNSLDLSSSDTTTVGSGGTRPTPVELSDSPNATTTTAAINSDSNCSTNIAGSENVNVREGSVAAFTDNLNRSEAEHVEHLVDNAVADDLSRARVVTLTEVVSDATPNVENLSTGATNHSDASVSNYSLSNSTVVADNVDLFHVNVPPTTTIDHNSPPAMTYNSYSPHSNTNSNAHDGPSIGREGNQIANSNAVFGNSPDNYFYNGPPNIHTNAQPPNFNANLTHQSGGANHFTQHNNVSGNNFNGSTHFYGNGLNYFANHSPNQRPAPSMGHRHATHTLPNASLHQPLPPLPPHASSSNPYYNGTFDPNYYMSNGGYGYDHHYAMSGNRSISPHMGPMSNSNRNHPHHQHHMMHHHHHHYAPHAPPSVGGGRYSQVSPGSMTMMNGSTPAAEVITPEMLSVANTSTMPVYGHENVCTQINNILSQSTKDHQAIVIATASSTNTLLQDSTGLAQLNGFGGSCFIEHDDVNEILRATGFDATNGQQCRPLRSSSNYFNGSNSVVGSTGGGGRFNSFPRHSQVVKSNTKQMFAGGGTNDLENTTTAVSGNSAGATSRSNMVESQSERNSISTLYHHHHHNAAKLNSLDNCRTNDPYLSSQKTVDFDPNEFERLHDSIRSGAIDLSISSDDDHRNMEFGPVGSNPRKIHYFQQQINQTPLPININTPTTVRRQSQNGNAANVTVKQKFKADETMNHSTTRDGLKRNSISEVVPRTRSLGDSADIQARIDQGVASAMNALSNLSIDRDFPELKSTVPTTSPHGMLCVHNTLKNFCTICQCDSPPQVPHESVLTRMSAASTCSYTTPHATNYTSTFRQSPRHSACEFRHQSESPRSRQPSQLFTTNNNNNSQSVGNSHVVVSGKPYTHTNNSHNNKIEGTGSMVAKKEIFSRKVFVGGLPQDITETQIALEFKRFGELVVDWPHKLDSNSGLPPKGYAFLLFEHADSVVNLINRCTKVDEKFFWSVSSQRSESKQVQIRPWTLTDAVWSPRTPIEKPVPRCKRTVFVGGIPRQAQARELFENMNYCFGGVDLVEIDVDLEYSYPKGAASVTFANNQCYLKALEAHFITLKLCGMEKRVEIKPFFSDDQQCEECGIPMNSRSVAPSSNTSNNNPSGAGNTNSNQPMGQYFCVDRDCLKYFCDNCWTPHQEEFGHVQPQQNKANGYHRQFQFRRTANHSGNNYNKSSN